MSQSGEFRWIGRRVSFRINFVQRSEHLPHLNVKTVGYKNIHAKSPVIALLEISPNQHIYFLPHVVGAEHYFPAGVLSTFYPESRLFLDLKFKQSPEFS